VRWRIGSAEFVSRGAVELPPATASDDGGHTLVWLGNDERIVAGFVIGDSLRADAVQTVSALARAGFRIVIASGDRPAAVRPIAERLDVEDWQAGLLPEDKLALVQRLRQRGEKVVMVGDGVNDAPVLAAADASIALDAGTALARATADAVVLGQRLGSVLDGVEIAGATRRIVRQNIGWAIAYNLTAVPLAASGMLAPWMAALGMSASSLVVVLNALRLQRRLPGKPPAEPRGAPLPAQREAAA
jgi:Cu2+-exporting ATPase